MSKIIKEYRFYQTEKQLLNQCIELLKILETSGKILWWRDNFSRMNNPGFPDLIVFFKDKTYLIELKSPSGSGRLTDGQKRWRDWFETAQVADYIVIDDFDDFKGLFEKLGIE